MRETAAIEGEVHRAPVEPAGFIELLNEAQDCAVELLIEAFTGLSSGDIAGGINEEERRPRPDVPTVHHVSIPVIDYRVGNLVAGDDAPEVFAASLVLELGGVDADDDQGVRIRFL